MAEQTPIEYLRAALVFVANRAASGAAYDGWPDEFARSEAREAWKNERVDSRKVSARELFQISAADLMGIGFRCWDENLIVIPLWAVHYLDPEMEVTCIDGSKSRLGDEDVDLDIRYGCIAYGFARPENAAA